MRRAEIPRQRSCTIAACIRVAGLPLSTKPTSKGHLSTSRLTGKLKLFLGSADVAEWQFWSRRGLFDGFVMNPTILERDGVRCNVRELTKLAEAGFALGADELHLQSWGDSHRELVSHALDLVGIDPRRIVVQLPCTDNGIIAANLLRDNNIRFALTGLHTPLQVITALALSAEYACVDGGLACLSVGTVVKMQQVATSQKACMRLMVSGIRVDDMSEFAALGLDTFVLSPKVAQKMLRNEDTERAVLSWEKAALRNL